MYGNHREKDFFWGALAGGAIATLTTLLFTTKKGKQIQHKIADAYSDVEESVKESFSEAKESVKESLSDAKEKAEDAADSAGKKLSRAAK